jgi:ABC-type dipeptide/oligopeptide/nickel transport system permease component
VASHLLRRLGGTLVVLVVVSVIIFVMLDVTPGDAAETLIGDSASAEQLAALRREMGLDLPLGSRYVRFLAGAVRGDLGRSLISGRPVTGLLAERLPHTVTLALAATGLATGLGMAIGIAAALRAGGPTDTLLMGMTSVGLAVPTFWSALLLMMFFSLRLGWLPVVGDRGWKSLILPTVTLALPTMAMVARLMRTSLLDTLRAPYVQTAHAKGIQPRWVLGRHVLRNSLIPVVTMLGLHLGHLMGGAFIVETIFGWPGVGRLMVQGIFDRDLPVVMGAALVVAAVYLALNVVVDLLQGWLDPRVLGQTL